MRTINYKVSYEKMISRLPAMFAFLDIDEQGTCEIVKATKGEQGNYGHIVANIKYDKGDFKHTCNDGTVLIVTNGEKTYRTLIDVYYKAINDKEWERDESNIYKEPFLAFMERGIGLRYVGLSEEPDTEKKCGVFATKHFPLAPDYVYLGEVKPIYNKMVLMKKQLALWEKHINLCKEDEKRYIQLKEEFEMYNGDKLITTLENLIKEVDLVAEEYLEYSANTNLCLDFNINLTNNIKDLGIVTPYIEEWIEGKYYYHNDVVYHVDKHGYGMTWRCDLNVADKSGIKTDKFGREYISGQYDEGTEMIYFEDGSQEMIDGTTPLVYWKPQYLNWVTRNERFICKDCGRMYEQTKPQSCECGCKDFDYYRYVNKQNDTNVISGTCNSHLTSFRRFESYMNRLDEPEMPDNYKDWLWYYRKGMVLNREEKYDELGNLAVMYTDKEGYTEGIEAIEGGSTPTNIVFDTDNETALNLATWGDVITSINAYNDKSRNTGKIEFEYWMGVHLKAKKGTLIVVNEDFTVNGKLYKKNTLITPTEYNSIGDYKGDIMFKINETFTNGGVTYKKGKVIELGTYNNLSEENKGKVRYIVKFAFKTEGTTYTFNQKIDVETFNNLGTNKKNILIVVAEEFVDKGTTYQVGEVISLNRFNGLNKLNKDKFKYIVKDTFKTDSIVYAQDQEIDVETFNTLGFRKDNIKIVVKEDFDNGGIIYDKDSEIDASTYESISDQYRKYVNLIVKNTFAFGKSYMKGEEISLATYNSLSESNKKNVKIIVEETFITGTLYKKSSSLSKDVYFSLKNEEKIYVDFIASNYFVYNNQKYSVGDVFPKDKYDKLSKDEKKNISFQARQDFYKDGVKYTKDDNIDIGDYLILDDLYKNKCVFRVSSSFTTEAIEYVEGQVIRDDVYNSLSTVNQKKCNIDQNWYSSDDDGNYKYYFKEFEPDFNSFYGKNSGVKYNETYIYNKSEEKDSIWQLVESGDFEDYVKCKFDRGSKEVGTAEEYKFYEKYEFDTSNNLKSYDFRIGKRINKVSYLQTNFTTTIDITHVDIEERPLIRYDYYNGISYQPSKNEDVYIERGVTQAFEKHLKFGEIKTLEDLENYANGGFFVISKEDIDLG